LLGLSQILRKKRLAKGALNLASPEVKVQVGSETSDPIDVEMKEQLQTNSLVEEFMLLANISVASRVYSSLPETALLRYAMSIFPSNNRRHGSPNLTRFEPLQNLLRVRKGLTLSVKSSKDLANSLDKCVDNDDPFFNTLVRIMATRCLLSAEYFASGSLSREEFAHYGLASDIYTHWTSPIRRYADVIVHRQLAAAIKFENAHPALSNRVQLDLVCKNINERHRNAQMAGRSSIEYYVGQALKNKSSLEDANVIKVFKNGFAILVSRFGVEGLLYNSDILEPGQTVEFDEANFCLIYKANGKSVQIGVFDRIKVRIETIKERITGKQKVKFNIIEPRL
jgi:exosome complex exonuclease DIS3/RRP44